VGLLATCTISSSQYKSEHHQASHYQPQAKFFHHRGAASTQRKTGMESNQPSHSPQVESFNDKNKQKEIAATIKQTNPAEYLASHARG